MPLAQITAITYENQWNGSQGIMHTSAVTLSDGVYGTANHKNQTPPYRVGETVEYQITGDFRGVSKLKIGKPQSQGQQGGHPQPQQSSPPPARQNAGNGQQSGFINGLNKLATLWCYCWDKTGVIAQKVGGLTPEQRQSACASLFIEANKKGLADGPIPSFGQPAPAPQPAPPPPQQNNPPPQRPRPGPEGSVALDDDNSDIPF